MIIAISQVVYSQTLPVGLFNSIEDSVRRSQLLGLDESGRSYMIRPLHNAVPGYNKLLYDNPKLKAQIYALPLVVQQQVNTHHPYGMNDNSMVQARGYQAMLSGGFFMKLGPLSVQLRPEYVYAENKDFTTIPENSNEPVFHEAYRNYVSRRIDNPEKFGEGNYKRGSWGQSSIRLNFDPVSFGLSNENLWWGPGFRNSLLMSNNASGFKHLTLNTTRPVDIYVGKIEAQIIAGRLEGSNFDQDKTQDWRYLSGVVLNYQPKWVPNLFLGFERTFIVYRHDMGNSFGDYFPLFSSFEKLHGYNRETGISEEDLKKRDQYFSLSARWVMPESHAEVYLEYGRNDHSANIRDFLTEPEHSRAYIAGFNKLIPIGDKNEFIEVGTEWTQLESPRTSVIRSGQPWYAHYEVDHGYTNLGQILGAGIGPGSNMQSLSVSWVKGMKRIGGSVERVVNNNDFFYSKRDIFDIRRHWVDFAFGGKFDWDFGRIMLNSNLTYIKSLNYQWILKDDGSFLWDIPRNDANNLHLKIGILYKW